ncbi:hypothetical protein ETAA8_57980 [Anatilimnocola aggregata]|uniref:Uncharacterized protein n=1 Tax=Anatilimnocola aggregata TaxID=2528021 RepID=A0A517YK93_9BACT|nr:hypothetical protein [Anatilimnocola aggregata]QDU30651.1 hypothetical protein ETAA8_57980 [Anatilimnocola aggregata]
MSNEISNKPVFWLTIITLSLLVSFVVHDTTGQEREAPGFLEKEEAPLSPGLARQSDSNEGITLTLCTSDLRKALVHDNAGKLVVDARSLTIEVPRLGERPQATCKMYLGVYEPTGAAQKTWPVREVRLVDEQEFQRLVDQGASALISLPEGPPRPATLPPSRDPADDAQPRQPPKVDRTGTIPLGGEPPTKN